MSAISQKPHRTRSTRANIIPEKTKGITGLILFTGIAIVTFGLFTKDPNILFYAIPITFALFIGSTRNSKDINDSISAIGFTTYNIKDSILIGISTGIFMFLIASYILSSTSSPSSSSFSATTGAIVPLFAIAGFTGLSTASIIPSSVYQGVNILMQWLVVAPSEEIGWRFLSPFIFNSFFNSVPIAFFLSILLWVFTHIPAYTLQNVSSWMYLALLLMGLTSVLLIYETGGLLASWVMHGTFNTLVLLITGNIFFVTYITLIFIMSSLIIFYFYGGEKHGKKIPLSI